MPFPPASRDRGRRHTAATMFAHQVFVADHGKVSPIRHKGERRTGSDSGQGAGLRRYGGQASQVISLPAWGRLRPRAVRPFGARNESVSAIRQADLCDRYDKASWEASHAADRYYDLETGTPLAGLVALLARFGG
jgi:hypothetical protein